MSMLRFLTVLAVAVAATTTWCSCAAEADPDEPLTCPNSPRDEVGREKRPAVEMTEREQHFAKAMSGAILNGFSVIAAQGELGALMPDAYRLGKVTKVDKDRWNFEYYVSNTDLLFEMPPLKVEWLDDTPIMVISKLKIKGRKGTFSARLILEGDHYSGTWSEEGGGTGCMFGVIVHNHEEDKEDKKT